MSLLLQSTSTITIGYLVENWHSNLVDIAERTMLMRLLCRRFGLVGHRTNNTALFFTTLPLIIVYLDIDYVKNAKSVNYWRNRYN